MKKIYHIFSILVFFACNTKKNEPLAIDLPNHFPDSIPFPQRNPMTIQGVALGKRLFYDTSLSANGQVSCATCHQSQRAFSDGLVLSNLGSSHKTLVRHTPALINLAWNKGLFWDGGVKNLESVFFAPLSHPDEMNLPLNRLVEKLSDDPTYPKQFWEVFGDSIRAAYVARALAQYQRTLISSNAKYDKAIAGIANYKLTALEQQGLSLFEENCASCHPAPLFTDHQFHNIGLDSLYPTEREHPLQGRYRITIDSADLGKFKTPTLRNISITAPYMHDGRFNSLTEVLDHYSNKMKSPNSLDSTFNRINKRPGIDLEEFEKKAIMEFLQTLTDSSFLVLEK